MQPDIQFECEAEINRASREWRAAEPHRLAQLVFDDLAADPEVWATHGMPSESKEKRIVARIARAFEEYAGMYRAPYRNTYE